MAMEKSYVSLKILNIFSFLAHAYVATRNLILKANCTVAPWSQDRFSATIFFYFVVVVIAGTFGKNDFVMPELFLRRNKVATKMSVSLSLKF